ncbi:MAG: hypothetical protein H6833_13115 [Planctomycetes bacterium]|nr:hypothetical protein [Planctomycetota bacterium]
MKTQLPQRKAWWVAGGLALLLSLPLAFAGNGGDDGLVGSLPMRGGGPTTPGVEPQSALFFAGSDHAIAGSISHVFERGDVHLAGSGSESLLAIQANAHVVLDVTRVAMTGVQAFVWLADDASQLVLPANLTTSSPVTLASRRLDVDVPRALYTMNSQGLTSLEFLVTGRSGLQRLTLSPDRVDPRAMHVVLEQM